MRHPQLYRCGAAWVAVTDLLELQLWSSVSDISEDFRQHELPRLVGHPVADAERLKAGSPVTQAARIQAPVLLAMGALDRRVPLEHGTRMRDALRAAGQAPEWIVYDDEGHGWLMLQTQLDFHQRLERFIDRHLNIASHVQHMLQKEFLYWKHPAFHFDKGRASVHKVFDQCFCWVHQFSLPNYMPVSLLRRLRCRPVCAGLHHQQHLRRCL